jgi:periplasmic protein TonB
VRRLFLAAALALVFHGLLFLIRFEGPKEKPILRPTPLTLSLAHGPTEPPPPLSVSKIPEPPDPAPQRPQAIEDRPPPKKIKKPEKSSKRVEPTVPQQQEPASHSADVRGLVAEEIPVSETPKESPLPTQASLGGGARKLPAIPVHEATPLYRRNPVPEYPLIARKRGYQGMVVLEVLVTREGKVKEAKLSASSGYSVLDQAALASVTAWLFDPGTRGGEKVDMWVKVPVRFQLE